MKTTLDLPIPPYPIIVLQDLSGIENNGPYSIMLIYDVLEGSLNSKLLFSDWLSTNAREPNLTYYLIHS